MVQSRGKDIPPVCSLAIQELLKNSFFAFKMYLTALSGMTFSKCFPWLVQCLLASISSLFFPYSLQIIQFESYFTLFRFNISLKYLRL